jgi:hypothetical protein
MRRNLPFFKNLYDSGFPDKWFSLVGNTLITTATLIAWREGSFYGAFIAILSYNFLIIQTTHGTRESYEYMKAIYVYPEDSGFMGVLISLAMFMLRAQFITSPFLLVWWAYATGKIPF